MTLARKLTLSGIEAGVAGVVAPAGWVQLIAEPSAPVAPPFPVFALTPPSRVAVSPPPHATAASGSSKIAVSADSKR
ncbi:MAG TPA: hypothetical protein VIF57_01465 [Polyangia bacterium]